MDAIQAKVKKSSLFDQEAIIALPLMQLAYGLETRSSAGYNPVRVTSARMKGLAIGLTARPGRFFVNQGCWHVRMLVAHPALGSRVRSY